MATSQTAHTYTVFGTRIRTACPFTRPLVASKAPPDLSFEVSDTGRVPVPDDFELVYESPNRMINGERAALLYNGKSDVAVLRLSAADYWLSNDAIVCRLHDRERSYRVEIDLLGTVLALWMEKRGKRALHGSAVRTGDRAVAFLGSGRAGKSTMAAMLVKQGYSLVTDDLLAVSHDDDRFLAHPGYPEIRLWPDHAQLFAADLSPFSTVHPLHEKLRLPFSGKETSGFLSSPVRLSHLFVLDRVEANHQTERIKFEAIPPQEAILALLSHSFLTPMIEKLKLQQTRLRFFGKLFDAVPMSRLSYTGGPERLDQIGKEIGDYLDCRAVSGYR